MFHIAMVGCRDGNYLVNRTLSDGVPLSDSVRAEAAALENVWEAAQLIEAAHPNVRFVDAHKVHVRQGGLADSLTYRFDAATIVKVEMYSLLQPNCYTTFTLPFIQACELVDDMVDSGLWMWLSVEAVDAV